MQITSQVWKEWNLTFSQEVVPVLPLRLQLWEKCKACFQWITMILKTRKALFSRDRLSVLSHRLPTSTCPSHLAQPWKRASAPPSLSAWPSFWTSWASSCSSSGSLPHCLTGTFLFCLGLCSYSSAWFCGYSGTSGISPCLRRSSTSVNRTYCDLPGFLQLGWGQKASNQVWGFQVPSTLR